MKRKTYLLLPVLVLAACSYSDTNIPPQTPLPSAPTSATSGDDLATTARGIFQPLPDVVENPENPITPAKLELGKMLYMDSRLSKTGNNSCNSCHNLATFGVDNEASSKGDAGQRGDRNSPSTFNAALHFRQFWDGRAKDVEEQAGMPIMNPVEMAIPSKDFLVQRLKATKLYEDLFARAYPGSSDPITYENLAKAIAAFERTLLTPSRFDAYLKGQDDALNAAEKEGLRNFIKAGCTTCHNGVALGGTSFKKFGQVLDYHPFTGSKGNDPGLMKETKKESDKDFFKVPSLRNISKTYPYFHDGSVRELDQAVKIMAKVQLNKELSQEEIKSIVTFLDALTADVPASVKKAPAGA